MSYKRTGQEDHMERHVLHENIIEGGSVLHDDDMFYEVLVNIIIFFQVHTQILAVLPEMCYPCRSCNQLCCFEFHKAVVVLFSSTILCALKHAFQEDIVYNVIYVCLGLTLMSAAWLTSFGEINNLYVY